MIEFILGFAACYFLTGFLMYVVSWMVTWHNPYGYKVAWWEHIFNCVAVMIAWPIAIYSEL